MKKKVLVLVLTLVMLASVLTVPAAAVGGKTFPDAKGHWAEESIMRWSRCGLVNGDDLGNVNPNKPLRRCEMATILSNMLGLRTAAPVSTFRDINGTEWYARAILRCAAAGIMQGSSDSMSLPEDYITREEAITMFCRALNVPRDEDPDLSKFSDGDKVSGWAAPYLTTLTELGILSGMGDGSVAPHDYINRAGAFTLMDKAISVYANAPGNYPSQNANGFVVINANTYQPGDVIISGKAVGVLVSVSTTDTVRLRDLSAENVDLNGKGSVIIAGRSSLDNVEAHTEIEMTVEANATVDTLDINSEKITLTNAGTIKNLSCDKVATVTNSGKVENLVADAAVSITNTGTVDKLVANAGIKVDNNKGTIKTAEINKGGVVMDGAPQQMTVATGVARPNNSGGRPVSASGAVSTPSGGSSSGSGSSSRPSSTVAVTGVTLSPSSWVMNAETTKTLTATVEPSNASNKNVTWKSSNTDVATVANGVVTAVAEGETTITVTTASGSKTATCKITVRAADANDPIPVKSVSFDKSKLELTEEETATLTLIIDPENATVDGAAKWESSDADVVKVDQNGKLEAVKPGTATIKATVTVTTTTTVPDEGGDDTGDNQGGAGDNTGEDQGETGNDTDVDTQAETTTTVPYTAECVVTVKAKPVTSVPVESVSISGKPAANPKAGDEFTLTATVLPENATDKAVTWTSSNTAVATVADGKVTTKAAGETTITAAAGGKSDSINLTVDPKGDDNPPTQEHEVALSQTSLTFILEDGYAEPQTLTVTVDGEPTTATVEWSGGNESIAAVDESGVVTAVGKGKTSITAKVTIDGKEYPLTCEVEVTEKSEENPPQPTITDVTLDRTGTIELTVDSEGNGGTVTITATIVMSEGSSATGTVAWSVTGDEGAVEHNETGNAITVTAKSAGTVTITATAGTKSAECTVTVEELPAPPAPTPEIESVTFALPETLELALETPFNLGDCLTVVVTPEDTEYTTAWDVVLNEGEEGAVATVDNDGQVTFTATGTVTIKVTVTITVENGDPITQNQTITLTLEDSDVDVDSPTE